MATEHTITYCTSCTAEIPYEAGTCTACGAEQNTADRTIGKTSPRPPAGWQVAPTPAYPVEGAE